MARTRSLLAAALCAAAVAALAAGPALAGEVTGSGKKADQNQGMSWCSFSGLNDDLVPLWTAAALTAPAAGRSPSGRTSSSVSPIRTSSILAWPATRTRPPFRPNPTGGNEALGPEACRRGQLSLLCVQDAGSRPVVRFSQQKEAYTWEPVLPPALTIP
jgi:hypothetical protein